MTVYKFDFEDIRARDAMMTDREQELLNCSGFTGDAELKIMADGSRVLTIKSVQIWAHDEQCQIVSWNDMTHDVRMELMEFTTTERFKMLVEDIGLDYAHRVETEKDDVDFDSYMLGA